MSTATARSSTVDLNFYFDPVCPFAWMTSTWVRLVADQRRYQVDWRFISLRLLNREIDYDSHFPEGYDPGHTAGLRLLRVIAKVRADYGRGAVGPLYAAIGAKVFDDPAAADDETHGAYRGTAAFLEPILTGQGLPTELAAALDDESWDAEIQAETDEALSLTGRDVGTPIIQYRPPDGMAFFGPVISRRPSPEEAVELWDHVVALTSFPGFAELKRSLRERPQLASFAVSSGDVGLQEDLRAGSRRTDA